VTAASSRPPRVRRSQADRSAETWARILAAVIECVDEAGFARTTSQRIARRAGVTVGAVQHHFLSKADILAAVLAESASRLAACFEDVEIEAAPLTERVGLFVERAWTHYRSPFFRAAQEILLSTREGREEWTRKPVAESSAIAGGIWRRVFAGLPIPGRRQRELLRFTFASLTGLAMMTRAVTDPAELDPQVETLKRALVVLMGEAPNEAG